MECTPKIASVLLELGLDYPLDYGVLPEHQEALRLGMRVQVPLRKEKRYGIVVGLKTHTTLPQVSPITQLLPESSLPPDLFQLAQWMEGYYVTPLYKILRSFLPSTVREKNFQPQMQAFVTRAVSQEKLRVACLELRSTYPAQAKVLDVVLAQEKGLFLSALLEETEGSRSPIETLVKKQLLFLQEVPIDRSPLIGEEYFKTLPKPLNTFQAHAVNACLHSLELKEFATYLLHGITGSGKTEVYLQIIDKTLEKGLSTIMLVPEIALTAQTIQRFRGRFEGHIAILHHRLSAGEKHDEWHRIRRGEAKIVIGARSALFSPVQNLGLVIVDEEHDSAYKQSEERPTYHARDMAVMRGKLTQSVVILGSATPSIESYHNAIAGKYRLLHLPARATQAMLPKVEIIDMRREYERAKGYTSFSSALIDKMRTRLERGEQTILFLNRRGYHTNMQCVQCGYIFKCSQCDLAMTWHLSAHKLMCHLCGETRSPAPKECAVCRSTELKFHGVGTEQIERALHAVLPQVRTLRMDGDTTRHKGSHDKLLREFRTGKADVLIGTQMIAKGLDFPSVTLVAILNADNGLLIPDFRASEQTFQLITQVAGRAGRAALPGEVLIQTQLTENTTITLAAAQDYPSFYTQEVATRKFFAFPPFTHLVKYTFSGPDPVVTETTLTSFRSRLLAQLPKEVHVHPVTPAGHAKIKNNYRFHFILRTPSIPLIAPLLRQMPLPKNLRVHLDIDAISTFF